MFIEQFDGLYAIHGFGHDFHVRLVVDDGDDAHAHDVMVIGDQDPGF